MEGAVRRNTSDRALFLLVRPILSAVAALLLVSTFLPAPVGAGVMARPGGAVVLTFDDACTSHLLAASLLEARGLRGTFYVVTGQPPPDPDPDCMVMLDARGIANLAARGHDVQSHTVTHPQLPLLGDAALERELADAQAAIERITGKRPVHFAYPYGEYDPRVKAAVAKHYVTGRGVFRDTAGMPFDVADPYEIPALEVERDTPPAMVRGALDVASTQGKTVILTFHDITDTPSTFGITPQTLERILDDIVARGLRVATMADAFSGGPDVRFLPRAGSAWWTQVRIAGADAKEVVRVDSRDDRGPWVELSRRWWGDHAGSYHVEPGHTVQYKATLRDGRIVESCAFVHPERVPLCKGTTAPAPRMSGAVVFTFDDISTDLETANMLENHGYRGTYYVVSGQIGQPAPFISRAGLASLAARGHDVQSHSVTHPDLTTLSDAALRQELAVSKLAVEAASGRPVKHFAYPYGAYDARVLDATRLLYATGRTVDGTIGETDPMRIPGLVIAKATTVETVKGYVDLAANRGQTVVLQLETLTASPGDWEWRPDQLEAVLDHVDARGVPVKTIDQVFGSAPAPRPAPSTFQAVFKNVRGNAWWVETDVQTSGGTLAGVDARVSGGAWVALGRTAWGSFAKSFYVPAGSDVAFRARAVEGPTVVSPDHRWPPG